MHEAPHAPWALRGEAVVGVVWARGPGAVVPGASAFRPLPGPAFVVAVHCTDSPVGPFVQLGVAVPARLGLRPGLFTSVLAVSGAAAKAGFRLNWGLPAEVGRVTWAADGDERVVRWEERGIEVRAVPFGVRVPVLAPTRGLQHRADGPVLLPRRVTGLGRLARVAVAVPEDDPLAWLAGRRGGATVSSARLVLHPARHPSGLLSSFRAPLRAAEPGLSYRGSARSSATAEALQ